MAQFYSELKSLRESRGISLEELESRTKINIRYLHAIEKGDFDLIELPYLRLFLRAYSEEIGGDSKKALEQLDSFTGVKKPSKPVIKEEKIEDIPEFSTQGQNRDRRPSFNSDQKLRQDLIKGSVLLLIFIFAIVIFRSIFTEESTVQLDSIPSRTSSLANTISETTIKARYQSAASSSALLSVEPPFFISVKSANQMNVLFTADSAVTQSISIVAGLDKTFPPFVQYGNILFPNTNDLTILVNGTSVGTVNSQPHPVRIELQDTPPSVKITHYSPSFN